MSQKKRRARQRRIAQQAEQHACRHAPDHVPRIARFKLLGVIADSPPRRGIEAGQQTQQKCRADEQRNPPQGHHRAHGQLIVIVKAAAASPRLQRIPHQDGASRRGIVRLGDDFDGLHRQCVAACRRDGDIGDVFIRFAQPSATLDDARNLVLDTVQRDLAVQRIIAREKGQRRTLVDDDDILFPLDVGFAD